jgi:ParB/RepB/Spo0J family partition protein
MVMAKESANISMKQITVPGKFKRDVDSDKRDITSAGHRDQRALIQSIKTMGLRMPITVKGNGKGYTLIDGFRRYRAFQSMKANTIPAYVIPDSDKTDLDALRFILNWHRENLKPLDEARLIKAMILEGKWTIIEAAKILGKKKSTLERYFDILRIDAKWQKIVNDRMISLWDAQPIAALSKKGQKYMLETIKRRSLPINGPTIRSIYATMCPIKKPHFFNDPKKVGERRINDHHGHPVTYKHVESVARKIVATNHWENTLRRYEDEISAVIPIIKKILATKEICEVLPTRTLTSFREFASEYIS